MKKLLFVLSCVFVMVFLSCNQKDSQENITIPSGAYKMELISAQKENGEMLSEKLVNECNLYMRDNIATFTKDSIFMVDEKLTYVTSYYIKNNSIYIFDKENNEDIFFGEVSESSNDYFVLKQNDGGTVKYSKIK